jgi:hypothetical protein
VGTLGMIIPASGGIGAYNLAMKFGFMALFISMGKSADGGEMGLTYSFISLPLQIMIMLVMGLISIPMLAKARNTAVFKILKTKNLYNIRFNFSIEFIDVNLKLDFFVEKFKGAIACIIFHK